MTSMLERQCRELNILVEKIPVITESLSYFPEYTALYHFQLNGWVGFNDE